MGEDLPGLEPIDLEPIDLEPIDLDPVDASVWPPGWYADPWSAGQYRLWNGKAWTGQTYRAGPVTTAPPWVRNPPRRRAGVVVAGLVVLVLLAGAVGYAIESSTETSNSATGSRVPAPTAPGSGSGSGSPTPAAADRAALATLVVEQADIDPTRIVVPLTNGNRTTEPTLDLCNGNFPSEKQRAARLQVAELTSRQEAVLSTEAVVYKRAAGGAQAFAELRKVRTACPHAPVTSPVGEPTVQTAFKARPDRSWPRARSVERLAYSFTTTSAGATSPTISVYLRRGRVLMGLYFPRPGGAQPAVAGKTSIEGIVGVFEARMARLPAKVVGGA